METERLFLAIALPSCVRGGLEERTRSIGKRADKVRWVPSANVHITLKFFGDTPTERKSKIVSTMVRVTEKVRPFDLAITGVKIVRRGKRPSMVWATVEDTDEQLRRLHGRTERLLEQNGFVRERRSLSPHITLARVRDGITPGEQDLLNEWALAQREAPEISFRVADILLMKSVLKPRGAEYTVSRRFAFQVG